jgi:hypothetical protein
VRKHDSKAFGITSRTTWPAAERTHEQLLRARLSWSLPADQTPTDREQALLSLLAAIGSLDIVAGGAQTALTRQEVRRRARDLVRCSWVSEAVRKAVERAESMKVGGVTSAVTAASVSS